MVTTSTGTADNNAAIQAAKNLIAQIWAWLENVCDPEVPVLSVLDLGVVRSVTIQYEGFEISSDIDTESITAVHHLPSTVHRDPSTVHHLPSTDHRDPSTVHHLPSTVIITITPTYTGCPAMSMISANIKLELIAQGLENVKVVEVLSPAWTTDWMRESGKKKLLEYGIAPPQSKARMDKMLFSDTPIPCPQCGSENTERISEFGSTACKSLHRCLDCREPFDYFKCH